MKLYRKFAMLLSAASMMLVGATACSGNADEQNADAQPVKNVNKGDKELPNYRYVDLDTLLSKYNLAKDYDEELLKLQTSMESTVRAKQNHLQGMQEQMQKKYQNNEYQTQTQVENEQKRLQNAAQAADKEVAQLQNNFQATAMQYQQTITDSIQAFIKRYNKKRGYDAIFFKNATLFINEDLDITAEVLEGLNASYNKKEKK